jgi:L-iditol 2-dehydrogenase
MKAIVQTGPSAVETQDYERPAPNADEVLVRVDAAGLCGSDAHAYRYESGYDWMPLPRIMGHEYAGTVVETGADVDDSWAGDFIVESPVHECGQCFQCINGQPNVCPNFEVTGMHFDGALAEYTTVAPSHLLSVSDGIPSTLAALAEPISVAARAVFDRSDVTPGDTLLVQGPGPIGILVAALAHSMGASVLVSGLTQDQSVRLPIVEDLGIETINVEEEELSERTEVFTDGIGMDVVFDASGHRSGLESAVKTARAGGSVVLVGLPEDSSEIFTTPIVMSEIDVISSSGSLRRNFRQAFHLLETRAFDPAPLIDTGYGVERPEVAFESFLASETCKPVFRFG